MWGRGNEPFHLKLIKAIMTIFEVKVALKYPQVDILVLVQGYNMVCSVSIHCNMMCFIVSSLILMMDWTSSLGEKCVWLEISVK